MSFKSLAENVNLTGEKAQEFLENTAELYKLRLFKSSMKFTTSLVNMLILGSVFLLFLAFFSIGMAYLIAKWSDSVLIGFMLVAGFYFVLFILILIFAKEPLEKVLISKFSDLLIEDEEPIADTEAIAEN